MGKGKSDLLRGTLELLVMKLLEHEPLNGYTIGQRIRSVTDEALSVDEGSLYPALYRMERYGWLSASWGKSENNRRAKFYSLTAEGQRQLGEERSNWADFSKAVAKILESA